MEQIAFRDIECLDVDLPEDMKKRKWYGDFKGLKQLISIWLKKKIPSELKKRLQLEQIIVPLLMKEYTMTKEEALRKLQSIIADFTTEEFDCLVSQGEIDWIYIDGQERYFRRLVSTLLKTNHGISSRSSQKITMSEIDQNELIVLDSLITSMKHEGNAAYHFRIRHCIKIKDESFTPGMVRVHIPVPHDFCNIKEFQITAVSHPDYYVSAPSAFQRTVFFEKQLQKNEEFYVEYQFTNAMNYVNLNTNRQVEDAASFSIELEEQRPHIVFTAYLKSLAKEITLACENELEKAKAIYDYITLNIKYSFMREYITLENIPEYCALSNKGDCGVQTLLFITLCRIVGIPARWQSGLYVTPYSAGSHDWAQFYVTGFGWLYADCSFGGAAVREGNEEKRQFYFGNLDCFRMPANSRFQEEFDPPKRFMRADPFDNQRGEIEYEDRGLNYDEFEAEKTVIEACKLENR